MKTTMMKCVAAAAVAVAGTVAMADGAGDASAETAAVTEAGAEVVSDGGLEAVRAYQEEAPAEEPRKPANAREEVTAWAKSKNFKVGRWDKAKNRFICVVAEQFDCADPAKTKDVMVQRDLAAKRAVLQAKAEIAEFISTELGAEDIAKITGDGEAQMSSAEFLADRPICGATCIRQSESWNNGKYQVAMAFAWSFALERSAEAILTGEKIVCKPKEGGKSVEDWLESVNPAFMSGPMQFVDADGRRWFLGVSAGAADDSLDSHTLKTNRRIADLSAKQMVAFSLFADVKAKEEMSQGLLSKKNDGKKTTETFAELESTISQSVKNMTLRGVGQLLAEEVEHPVTGGKIYVSIYGIDQDGAEAALAAEAKNYKAKAAFERQKNVEKDRDAANAALVESAKKDGAAKGAKAKKGQAAPKPERKAQSGVFNSGADVDDDDI